MSFEGGPPSAIFHDLAAAEGKCVDDKEYALAAKLDGARKELDALAAAAHELETNEREAVSTRNYAGAQAILEELNVAKAKLTAAEENARQEFRAVLPERSPPVFSVPVPAPLAPLWPLRGAVSSGLRRAVPSPRIRLCE